MVVIISYRKMFEEADEKYKRFESYYNLINSRKNMDNVTRTFAEQAFYDMFKVHPDIRESYPGLNGRLEKMLNKGFLKLKKSELCAFDPVTMKASINYDLTKAFGKAFKKN